VLEKDTDPFINTYLQYFYLELFYLKNSVFLDITPCSPLKVNRRFGGIYRLHPAEFAFPFTLVYLSTYSFIRKLKAICSSEASICLQRATRSYIPENSTLRNHRCENLKSYINFLSLDISNPVFMHEFLY
jgi:hypothetical protein